MLVGVVSVDVDLEEAGAARGGVASEERLRGAEAVGEVARGDDPRDGACAAGCGQSGGREGQAEEAGADHGERRSDYAKAVHAPTSAP